jgi:riboflavin kinase / FMN adenylyltransferase
MTGDAATEPVFPHGLKGAVVTVGTFDGVHCGHQAVLREIGRRAREAGRSSVLVTFEPHPLEVVAPERAPPLLTPGDERLEMLAQMPLDYVLLLRFDRSLASVGPEEFVRRVLLGRCGMGELVIGHDHGFGRDRSGDVETLRSLGASLGFAVDVVSPVDVGGQPVSSSRIRRAVAAGELALAAHLLGRPYQVSGRVARGEQRGRRLGVPTINLEDLSPRKLLPPDGVYAVRVEWPGGSAAGMMNQGARPTFHQDGRRTLEAHLFDFDGDLYGARVRVEWVARLRDIRPFASPAELQAQLQHDRVRALAALAGADPDSSSVSHA